MTDEYGEFEGRPVLSTAVELPSLAGGLRDAAEVEGGRIIHKDDEGFILIKYRGNKTRFDPIKDTEGFQRVDIPLVEGLTFVEGKAFERAIDRHAAALEKHKVETQLAKEQEQGVRRIPGTEPVAPDVPPADEGTMTDDEWEKQG